MVKKQHEAVTSGSSNVFADIGLPEAETELTKAQLASQIRCLIEQRQLTQTAAAKFLGVDQPQVSALLNGRLATFSSDRLMRFLTTRGQDVEIRIKPKRRGRGAIKVVGSREADAA